MAMKPIGVSQLNAYIKRVLQTDPLLNQVSVVGEISNLKYHDSGHVYFSLKDQGGKINCFLPSSVASSISVELEDGMELIAIGNVSVFERGGYYSLQIKAVEVSGVGDLGVAFDALKKKLFSEGLFDASHKKSIPGFPSKVAIMTAQTGAALQDMIKIITGRNNVVDILIVPVLVQGPGAAASISEGINNINKMHPEIDTIIVGRGGGSLEELWAFNEEVVARSIYASTIPIISAVGHETDVTIADYAADVRAETPTAAAALAVPDTKELRTYLDFLETKLQENLEYNIDKKNERLSRLDLFAFQRGIIDKIEILSLRNQQYKEQLQQQLDKFIEKLATQITESRLVLDHLNPKAIMEMGYAALTTNEGFLVTSTANLQLNNPLSATLRDGKIETIITKIERE